MKPAADMRAGMVIQIDGDLYRVIHADYQAGGGKMHGVTHAKLHNIRTSGVTERRFRQDERFDEVELDRQVMEFLYTEGEQCVFMNPETFDQINISKERLGGFLPFLQPNQSLKVDFFEDEIIEVICPPSAEIKVVTTPEPLHIQNSSVLKEAALENGEKVQVPQFIKPGDIVRVEVETGKYLERVR